MRRFSGSLVETQGEQDKNTWRGITLLSVGSKLLARVVAIRLRSWFDSHLGLHESGFRRGKGVDDALQVAHRLVEEVATSTDGSEGIELSFHDIEKAYPRICRCFVGLVGEMGM